MAPTTGVAVTGGDDESSAVDSGREDGVLSRRAALRAVGGAAVAGAALGTVPEAGRAQSGETDLGSWFEDVSNYDGVVDETGSDSVTVEVGVEANGGGFGFGPAAVRIDPGTTVIWSWIGAGGSHNVAASDGEFESDLVDSDDHTFEHTFEDDGVYTYACTPHQTLGMKGAVVVGDVEVESGGGSGTTTSSGGGSGGDTDESGGGGSGGDGTAAASGQAETEGGADGGSEPNAEIAAPFGDAGARQLGGLALGGVFGLALASPGLFGAFLWLTGGDERPDEE
jgi:halocyanin-like protein